MNAEQRELEQLAKQVTQLLEREKRAMHTGDIACRLGVPTYRVHTAMHVPLQRGLVWFHSSEGYSLPQVEREAPAPGQLDLGTAAKG